MAPRYPSANYPNRSRPWYTIANVEIPDFSSLTNQRKALLWTLKQAITNPAQLVTTYGGTFGPLGAPPAGAPWKVEGSSDSLTAGMDGVDRWGAVTFDAAKLVPHNTGAHSWIALSHSGAEPDGGNFYLLFDYNPAPTLFGQWSVWASRTPFTGGTTIARPTATDEFQVVAAPQTFHSDGTTDRHRCFLSIDTQGNFYWWTARHNMGFANWFATAFHLQDYAEGDRGTFFFVSHNATTSPGTPTVANNATAFHASLSGRTWDRRAAHFGGVVTYNFGYSNAFSGSTAWGPRGVDAKWEFLPALVGTAVALRYGIRGRVPDFYATPRMTSGQFFPGPDNRKWIAIGEGWLVPFDQVVIF